MKGIKDIKNYDFFFNSISEIIRPEIRKSVDNSFSEMHKSFQLMATIGYRISLFFTWIFIIPILIHFYLRYKQRQLIISKINLEHLFDIAFQKCSEIEFLNTEEKKDTSDLKINRVRRIPSDAMIVKASKIYNLKLINKYECKVRVGMARWIRSSGKSVQVYYCNTGYIIFDFNDKKYENFNFNLVSRHKLLKFGQKTLFENDEFNKEFFFTSNNLIKSRMMYTPLAMELTLKLSKHLKKLKNTRIKWWSFEKKQNKIIIIFEMPSHFEWNLWDIYIRFLNTKEKIENAMINDFIDHVYMIYELFSIANIPILL